MSSKPEQYWENIQPQLRRHLGLNRPTLKEAQAAFDAAEELPLSKEELDSIVSFAITGQEPAAPAKPKCKWFGNLGLPSSQPGLAFAFNRNAGPQDEEVIELMQKLREDALGNEEDESKELDTTPGKEK